MPNTEYDISRAFKRIENDLIDSMMRNMKRHQVEEADLGIEWEQWQAIQLAELEEYRKKNLKRFSGDFSDIQDKIDDMFYATYNDAQSAEEHRLMDRIKKGDFRPTEDKGGFFRLNEPKLEALLMATKADFARAEYAMLRRANDQYRKIIFDSMTYANITNDYAKAVDMATKDFLKAGINSVVYKNGARHNVADYAYMALRTGNKRAYLMGEGNAHDRYGLHTVRVNKRPHACPKCVGFLGRLLIDDVYGGGTRAEATAKGIPTLSDAMQAGFLHPNCKDMYSAYIEGVSKPAKPWSKEEVGEIVGEYNQEQELKHAQDMKESYERMAKYSLDPSNQQTYQARADNWQARIDEIRNTPAVPVAPPVVPSVAPQPEIVSFTDDERTALEEYVSGDGMWINQYLRGNGDFGELSDLENKYLNDLVSATSKPLEATDKLYRSVDASVIFSDLSEEEVSQMMTHLYYGDSAYDKGAYSQGIKKRMETALNKAQGKEITEKGFMSTTVDKKVAEEFGDFTGAENPVVIEFDTKGKKLKGADLDFLDIEDDPQRERLLARNTRYKVTDIGVATTEDGVKYIKVNAEIIDQLEDVAEETAEEVVDTFDRNNIAWSSAGQRLQTRLESEGVVYRKAELLKEQLSETQIIDKISGADQTKGSCVSVALSYIGNKCGYDVLDFRDGDSRRLFSMFGWNSVTKLNNINAVREMTDTVRPVKKIMNTMQEGKQYLLSAGRHTSIVRVNHGVFEYLELQSGKQNGWQPFERDVILFKGMPYETTKHYNVTQTLNDRFGVKSSSQGQSVLVDIDEFKNSDEFRDLIGYINTAENEQRKGAGGGIK